MKLPLRSLALLASAIISLNGQDTASTTSTARIEGNIPDGTPPPPELPKPKFTVRSRDILKSETHLQGGRKITLQEIAPIALPAPPSVKAPAPIDNPAVQEQLDELRRNRKPTGQTLFIGATVFRFPDASTRTFVRLSLEGQGEPIVFWSSADFALLSGMSSFIGSDGIARSYLMAWSSESIEDRSDRKLLPTYDLAEIPILPSGKPTFTIISGSPAPETLIAIQSIHDLIENDQPRLQAAYNGRENTRIQHEAEQKAHPPKPKDLILNHWTIRPASAAAIEGGTK